MSVRPEREQGQCHGGIYEIRQQPDSLLYVIELRRLLFFDWENMFRTFGFLRARCGYLRDPKMPMKQQLRETLRTHVCVGFKRKRSRGTVSGGS